MKRSFWCGAMALSLCAALSADPARSPLSPGDRLQIKVMGEPELSKDYQVDESGQIKLELVGSVRAAGMSVSEFQSSLEQALGKYIKKPVLTVFAFQRVAVGGGVRQPGGYDFPKDEPVRVMDALTKAGGFSERAHKERVVVVRRDTDGKPETLLVDVSAYLKHKKSKADPNPILHPNDLVYVDVEDPEKRHGGLTGLLEKVLPLAGLFLGN